MRHADQDNQNHLSALFALEAGSVLVWLMAIFLSAVRSPVFGALRVLSQEAARELTSLDLAIGLGIAIVVLALIRRTRIFGIVVAIVLSFLTFSGLSLYVSVGLAFSVAVALLLYERLNCSFLSNNLFVFVSVLFGALPIGIAYPIEFLVVVLIVVSAYDVIGVFLTRFIPTLALGAIVTDVPLLVLAPRTDVSWKERPTIRKASAVLGVGDVFLPALFLSAVTFAHGIPLGLITLAGAIIGGLLNTALAVTIRTGIPAVPLLAAGMTAAYFLFRA